MTKKIQRVVREERVSADEKARHDQIRAEVRREFPSVPSRRQPASSGIAADLHRIREERGLTWYDVARLAGIDASTVRDAECGRDTTLAHVEAIARVLGLKLELIEAP